MTGNSTNKIDPCKNTRIVSYLKYCGNSQSWKSSMTLVTTGLACHYNHNQDCNSNGSSIVPTSFDSLSNQVIQSVLHLNPINHHDQTNVCPTCWILMAKYLTNKSWRMKWPAYMNPHPSTQWQCCSHHKNNKSSILTSLPNKKLHSRHNNKNSTSTNYT